jgi:hypothetical protein
MDNAKWFTTDVNNIDPYLVTISEIENKFGFYFTGIINEQQYKNRLYLGLFLKDVTNLNKNEMKFCNCKIFKFSVLFLTVKKLLLNTLIWHSFFLENRLRWLKQNSTKDFPRKKALKY